MDIYQLHLLVQVHNQLFQLSNEVYYFSNTRYCCNSSNSGRGYKANQGASTIGIDS